MFDVKEAQAEAEKEIRDEAVKEAKGKIKAKLREISTAKQVLANAEREYETLLLEIGADAG